MNRVDLSLVVPAYNEEKYIENTISALNDLVRDKYFPYEIVVVDDGSKDSTALRARRYAKRNDRVKVISYAKNMGKGHAVKTGFMESVGDVVVFADSDMEINLETISQYLKALEHGDIVIASKWIYGSAVDVPLRRKIMSHAFNSIVRLLTGIPLRDTQSGLKAMKKSAFEGIFPRLAVKRYAFDVELLAVAHLFGLKIVEMPVKIKMDTSFSFRHIAKMLIDLLGVAYRLRVIHWYQRRSPAKNGLQNMVALITRER